MKRTLYRPTTLLLTLGAVALLGACSGEDCEIPDAGVVTTNNTNNNTVTTVDAGPTCDPACDESACQFCVVDGDTAACHNACGDGLTCEDGQCIAPEVTTCDPTCDANACMVCDTTGAEPMCRMACAEGTTCNAGVCEADAVAPEACDPACGPCQACDISGAEPVCIDMCGADEACNVATDACVRAGFHSNFEDMVGPFTDGPSVTQVCVGCHLDAAQHVVDSPHYKWQGATPGVLGHETGAAVGKKNLINNFCVSVPGNEARCSQCHAGYGYADDTFDFDDITKIDCLACHADPASGYKKAVKTAGTVDPSVDLLLAAQSVGQSTRANCGACHFNAGGGDNVKKGDLGSAMMNPTRDADVHMGAGMNCSNCHADENHTILGQGAHLPTTMGRLACEDCHGATPHTTLAILNTHAIDIACQTCHVPAFSRQQPTKMWWDWSTAGNKTIGTDGIEMGTTVEGTAVQVYNYQKGNFVWEENVKPTFAWWDGRVSRMTLSDTFPAGAGLTAEDPIYLARPLATKADTAAKIFPFKVMTGKQPAHLTDNYMIAPDLFGPGSFWAGIPAAADYTPEGVRALWTTALNNGALIAGQIAQGETIADGDWDFLNTAMYMGINHEVAPKEMALGRGGCTGCHMNPEFPWADLGYTCDPLTAADPASCGTRR